MRYRLNEISAHKWPKFGRCQSAQARQCRSFPVRMRDLSKAEITAAARRLHYPFRFTKTAARSGSQ